jgi:cyclic pyranopterin phosphate synthase
MNPATLAKHDIRSRRHPEPENAGALRDSLNRPLHDLRISVIDRCNFRCTYCMPEDERTPEYVFLKQKQWLDFDEIVRLTRLLVGLGACKVRLTGGEPLLRPELPRLIGMLRQIPGIEDLALTTNGSLLAQHAAELRRAGLKRLTVSLDTLDEDLFLKMSGGKGNVGQVLAGLKEAQRQGFERVKINTVVRKGLNDRTLLELVQYFRGSGHVVRFIEYMDVGNCNHWQMQEVVPSAEILAAIHREFPLKAAGTDYYGEVAERYEFIDGQGEVGFISSVTQPFCGTCTRARISTDGKLYTCLFASDGEDLRAPLREGKSDADIREILQRVWTKRKDRYSQERSAIQQSEHNRKKIEMYQIGG